MTRKNSGYLLTAQARSLDDRLNNIPLTVVRAMFQEVINSGHHVLALINSCYSGSFVRRSFGKRYYQPKYPGAHAITAGGTAELTWHDAQLGKGSIFFEKLLAGLYGRADILPFQSDGTSGDGIVTVGELMEYLRQEVSLFTDQQQNPKSGDLTRDGSNGGFFFLNRLLQVDQDVLPPWEPRQKLSFGPEKPRPPPTPPPMKSRCSQAVPVPKSTISVTDGSWSRSLPAFCIDRRPVRNRDFLAFVNVYPKWKRSRIANSLHNGNYLKRWDSDDTIRLKDLDDPVGYVSYYAASAYCEAQGKVLPSLHHYRAVTERYRGNLIISYNSSYTAPRFKMRTYEWTTTWWNASDFQKEKRILYEASRPYHTKWSSRVEPKHYTRGSLGFRCVTLLEP